MICLTIFVLSSCENEDNTEIIIPKDNYYVKYNIRGNGVYRYFSNFSVNTDQGIKSFSGYQYGSWNNTYGPVKKGFMASASVEGDVTIDIYVSKNTEPFALKASKNVGSSSSTNRTLSYKIDF